MDSLTLEDGTGSQSQNVINQLPINASQHPKTVKTPLKIASHSSRSLSRISEDGVATNFTQNLVASQSLHNVCQNLSSICGHQTTEEPPHGVRGILHSGSSTKICNTVKSLVKIELR